MNGKSNNGIFIVIVAAQFCGTSLWFASNAALPQLQQLYHWPDSYVGHLTASIQLGFIAGTLTFALLALADKFSPSRLFFICCLAGSLSNLLALIQPSSFALVLLSRALTGFSLAGVYPVGMKIAADWQEKGLGHWLGALVGALVLGTAFPHALRIVPRFVSTEMLLTGVSILATAGGLLVLLWVPDGPFRKRGTRFSFSVIRKVFRISDFRAPALSYFGHMWEVYAFWAFAPWAVHHYFSFHPTLEWSEPLASFIIISAGALGCFVGGLMSFRIGSARVALYSLICSSLCCLASPFIWKASPQIFMSFMILWGLTVVSDSPQFSALVARNAPDHLRGSALTLVTCIGFGITIFSLQLLSQLQQNAGDYLFLLLAPGPVIGIIAIKKVI